MRRWLLDNSDSVAEPELAPFDRKDLQVTKSGQVLREFPHALSVADLNLRRARELTSARRDFWQSRDVPEALARVRELAGVDETILSPEI